MFGFGFGEWLVIFALVLILFGAERLPKLARGLGRLTRQFQHEVKEVQEVIKKKDLNP